MRSYSSWGTRHHCPMEVGAYGTGCTNKTETTSARFLFTELSVQSLLPPHRFYCYSYYRWRIKWLTDDRKWSSCRLAFLVVTTLKTKLMPGFWNQGHMRNRDNTKLRNCSRKSYATQFTFFNPWFRTAHRHLMTLDFAPMTNFWFNKTSYLNDREFIIRMLYKDSYWLLLHVL